MALQTAGFALSQMPRAPDVPAALGVVAPIDFGRVQSLALAAHRANLEDQELALQRQQVGASVTGQGLALRAAHRAPSLAALAGRENLPAVPPSLGSILATPKAPARRHAARNAVGRAHENVLGAIDDLHAARSGGDANEIEAAQAAVELARQYRDKAELGAMARGGGVGMGQDGETPVLPANGALIAPGGR